MCPLRENDFQLHACPDGHRRTLTLGVPVAELIRQVGITEQTLYRWKKQ